MSHAKRGSAWFIISGSSSSYLHLLFSLFIRTSEHFRPPENFDFSFRPSARAVNLIWDSQQPAYVASSSVPSLHHPSTAHTVRGHQESLRSAATPLFVLPFRLFRTVDCLAGTVKPNERCRAGMMMTKNAVRFLGTCSHRCRGPRNKMPSWFYSQRGLFDDFFLFYFIFL